MSSHCCQAIVVKPLLSSHCCQAIVVKPLLSNHCCQTINRINYLSEADEVGSGAARLFCDGNLLSIQKRAHVQRQSQIA
jgi:hypothetical protein